MNGIPVTDRKQEVLWLLADGWTTKQIALQLCISTETVKSHRRELLRQYEARNVANLIYKAYYYETDPKPTK